MKALTASGLFVSDVQKKSSDMLDLAGSLSQIDTLSYGRISLGRILSGAFR